MIGALTGRGEADETVSFVLGIGVPCMGQEGYGAGFSCCVEADIGETAFMTF